MQLTGTHGQLELTPAGHRRLHFPDCVVVGAPGESAERALAVELERTAKGRTRLRRILAGYIAARHIGAVRYYALGERVRNLVQSEVGAQRAHALIDVRAWPAQRQTLTPSRGQAVLARYRELRDVNRSGSETAQPVPGGGSLRAPVRTATDRRPWVAAYRAQVAGARSSSPRMMMP